MIRATQLTVMPKGGKIFDLGVYTVTVDDESGGEFVVVEEQQESATGKICIEPKQWPELRKAIDRVLKECKP